MRKAILFGLLMALFVAIVPAFAQDNEGTDEAPIACTPEEITATGEAITQMSTGFQNVMGLMGDGTDPAAITVGVVGLQALSTGYWNEVYPALPACIEASSLGYNFGLALDETLISTSLARLALYENEHGDAAFAASLADYAKARGEWYQQVIKNTFGAIGPDGDLSAIVPPELPACTEEDSQNEAVTALNDSLEAYKQLGTATPDATPEQLSQLIGGYAAISGAYWAGIYPALPACYEISTTGYNVGLVYNESVITLTLARLAMYEAEFGNADAATALSEGAAARQELFAGFVANAFPQEEAAATEEAE